jgi:uncharacterized protein (TIGR00255 family)
MIRSMTGYGQGAAEGGGLRVTTEARSVNNRFADVRLKLPPELMSREGELRRRVLSRVRRGRVEVFVGLERSDGLGRSALNRSLVASVVEAARALRDEHGVKGRLDLATVLSLPGVLQTSALPGELAEETLQAVERSLNAALDALDADRAREGEALRADLRERVARMEHLTRAIRARAAGVPELARRKLVERVQALAQGVEFDPARLAQEVALIADRSDVTEELVRLAGHLDQAGHLLAEPDGEPVGKRFDFLLQEIHRETNTASSKSGDLELTRLAMDLKAEAEKVREQIQNLE